MACPKKKTSKSKRDKRRANWKHLGSIQAAKAMSMGKSILTGRAQGFYYPTDDETEETED
jgi:large subunit ribosomal protein L32